jgi:hypothetical protein
VEAVRLPLTVRTVAIALVVLVVGAVPAHATAPQITSFAPASGTIGNQIVINGTGFTGATAIKFNGAAATAFTVVSATKITAGVPAGASTGPISVTTPGGTGKSISKLTITPGFQLSSAMLNPLGNVTVTGVGFDGMKAIDVYFDTTDLALAASSANGLVSAALQVPQYAQPGSHWITLVERGTNLAVQTAFQVSTNWPMGGFSAQGRGYNAYENTLNIFDVAGLTDNWFGSSGGFANPAPFVEYGGNIFVGDTTGKIRAYSSVGILLWTASAGNSSLQSATPVAFAGKVFFGAQNGNVYAFYMKCRSDGGTCTPVWTKSVGTSVTASLTIFGNKLYVPSSDGSIHVLDPTTGAPGTPIYGFDTTHGAVTTPPAFGIDGSFFYAAGTALEYKTSYGVSGIAVQNGTVSPLAAYNGAAYYTTSDGNLHEFLGAGWTASTSGTGCTPAPVIANDTVFAGGCSSITAFAAGDGTAKWSTATSGSVIALSIANGVLYGCVGTGGFGGLVVAYNATTGQKLWTGNGCNTTPIAVNGTVYSTYANLTAYNLPGANPNRVADKPTLSRLRPDYSLRKQFYRPASTAAAVE